MAELTFTPVPDSEITRRLGKALTPDELRWCAWLDTLPQRTAYEEQYISLKAFVAGTEKERAAAVEKLKAAGCVCAALVHLGDFRGSRWFEELGGKDACGEWHLDQHDPRCPIALSAAILARGEG